MIDNIIFDWSGVIKDSVFDHLLVTNRMFKKLGVREITLEELQENWRQPYMLFYNKYLPNLTIDQFKILYKEMILESPRAKEYLGVSDLIKKVKKAGKKVAILSSDSPNTILLEMKNFGLENVFDDMIMDVHDKGEVIQNLIKGRFNILTQQISKYLLGSFPVQSLSWSAV